ncbi:MAG: hypothetical protein HQ594_06515, partial [Candidatus Omnitrophica bacterium]|nr:hypothetical protein [Candidatus Omnitrophota bacterium]
KQKISRPIPTSNDLKKETTLYDFENGDEGWGVPAWAVDKPDHVAEYIEKIDGISTKGTGSLGIYAEFPGNTWSGALIEIPQFLDLKDYDVISADIYLPPEAPRGLRAKLILTVGEAWKFTEMSRAIRLTPGKWTSVTAALTDDSADWKRTKVTEAFRRDVRKIAIRIESNKPAYSGPVIVDNVRVGAYK